MKRKRRHVTRVPSTPKHTKHSDKRFHMRLKSNSLLACCTRKWEEEEEDDEDWTMGEEW